MIYRCRRAAPAANSIGILTSGVEAIHIAASSNVGINKLNPVVKLDVEGAIKFGYDSSVCAPSLVGTIRYNNGPNRLEYCNGTTWVPLTGGPKSIGVALNGTSNCAVQDLEGLSGGSSTDDGNNTCTYSFAEGFSNSPICTCSSVGEVSYRVGCQVTAVSAVAVSVRSFKYDGSPWASSMHVTCVGH